MTTQVRQKKPILPFMVDCETLSLSRSAAVIDIAIAPIGDTHGEGKRFLISPDSYGGMDGFIVSADTIAFHEGNKTGLIEDCRARGKGWQLVSEEFRDYLGQFAGAYEIHLWSQGKDFDGPILENLLHQAGMKTPWKYSHFHCLRDFSQFYPEVKRTWWGNHTAMKDVIAQISHIKSLAAYDDRFYRFLYGAE